jgi:hypothetical protein
MEGCEEVRKNVEETMDQRLRNREDVFEVRKRKIPMMELNTRLDYRVFNAL